MIQRTGFGKSLCYQYPATQFDGITVIFSPLIALMRDQVKALNNKGILASFINSEQSPDENGATIQAALDGKIKILYGGMIFGLHSDVSSIWSNCYLRIYPC